VRSLERRVRDHKRTVERLNPLEHPDRYHDAFDRLVELEAELRDLRRAEPPTGGRAAGRSRPGVLPTSAGRRG
jgi:hypothetical protein